MAPPRRFNRRGDIFLFFSNSLPHSLSPSLSAFLASLFFTASSPPSVPLGFKGKVFAVGALRADPGSPPRLPAAAASSPRWAHRHWEPTCRARSRPKRPPPGPPQLLRSVNPGLCRRTEPAPGENGAWFHQIEASSSSILKATMRASATAGCDLGPDLVPPRTRGNQGEPGGQAGPGAPVLPQDTHLSWLF